MVERPASLMQDNLETYEQQIRFSHIEVAQSDLTFGGRCVVVENDLLVPMYLRSPQEQIDDIESARESYLEQYSELDADPYVTQFTWQDPNGCMWVGTCATSYPISKVSDQIIPRLSMKDW